MTSFRDKSQDVVASGSTERTRAELSASHYYVFSGELRLEDHVAPDRVRTIIAVPLPSFAVLLIKNSGSEY